MPTALHLMLAAAGLWAAAVGVFSWRQTASRVLGVLGVATVLAALLRAAVAHGGDPLWDGFPVLFAVASAACGWIGTKTLLLRSERWVHRFVIYTGYGATFAVLAAIAAWQHRSGPPLSGLGTVALFGLVYALGSAAIFVAKTFTVRRALLEMPEYRSQDGRL